MNQSPYHLAKAGDYYFQSNIKLTQYLLKQGAADNEFREFAEIALHWAARSKDKLQESMFIGERDGELVTLEVSNIVLKGEW